MYFKSKATRVLMGVALLVAGVAESSLPAGAAIAPNGLIAYSAWEGVDRDIYTVDPSNPSVPPVRLTTDGRSNENPDWSPDGSQIVYDSFLTTNQPTIHVMNADGSGITQISATPCCDRDFQPNWSPDGQRIAFVSTRDGDGEYEIYVMNDEGERIGPPAIRLTNYPAAEFGQGISDSQPTWSPDSSRLAFLSNGRGSGPDSCDLYVMDAVDVDGNGFGDNLTRLTFDDSFNCSHFDDVNPAWSPDSSMIAFDSPRSGDFEVWVVDANNISDIRNVTANPGYDGQPEWSPDGTQLTFVSSRSGADELWSVEAPRPLAAAAGFSAAAVALATATQITDDQLAETKPSWGAEEGGGGGSFTLTAVKAGTGSGTVTSAPVGISCGADCSEVYVSGTTVTLTPRAGRGSTFTGWSGACSGTGSCVVTMSAAQTATATFSKTTTGTFTLTVAKAGSGSGTVSSNPAGIKCGADCAQAYASGTMVTLTARAGRGSTFTGWSGACSGTGPCVVTMSAAKTVTATFN